MPTDKEHEQLTRAYQAMKKEGRRVTQQGLGNEATLSKGKAAWWLKHTDDETKMEGYKYPGTNIVPIGKVTKL